MSDEALGRSDVAVVGAGIIGLAVGYELLRRGKSVVLLERSTPGSGATHVAAGMLAPASEADLEEPALLTFGFDSLRRYPNFVRELEELTGVGCGLRSEGTIWVALDRDDREHLEHFQRIQRLKGVSSRWITRTEVVEREPRLSGRIVGGLFASDDLQVDPRLLSRALVAAIEKLGGRILVGRTVSQIETVPGGNDLIIEGLDSEGARFTLTCHVGVLAAGAWSSTTINLPSPSVAVRPVKGQLVRLRGPRLVDHVIRTPRVYLVPRASGELLLGATMEEQGFDPSATAGAVMDLLRRAWEVLPSIEDLELAEVCVGFRPAARDNLPVIGRSSIESLFLAIGHYRNGVLLAPATAQELAEQIATGRERPALGPFGAGRFAPQVVGEVLGVQR